MTLDHVLPGGFDGHVEDTTAFVLPGPGHLLQIENAAGTDEALGEFFGRHGFPRLPGTHRTLG